MKRQDKIQFISLKMIKNPFTYLKCLESDTNRQHYYIALYNSTVINQDSSDTLLCRALLSRSIEMLEIFSSMERDIQEGMSHFPENWKLVGNKLFLTNLSQLLTLNGIESKSLAWRMSEKDVRCFSVTIYIIDC